MPNLYKAIRARDKFKLSDVFDIQLKQEVFISDDYKARMLLEDIKKNGHDPEKVRNLKLLSVSGTVFLDTLQLIRKVLK